VAISSHSSHFTSQLYYLFEQLNYFLSQKQTSLTFNLVFIGAGLTIFVIIKEFILRIVFYGNYGEGAFIFTQLAQSKRA